jgi:hypothetical protein
MEGEDSDRGGENCARRDAVPLLFPLWEKVDRRDSAETDEGCSSGVRRWLYLEHPSSVAYGDTFSHKGRRGSPPYPAFACGGWLIDSRTVPYSAPQRSVMSQRMSHSSGKKRWRAPPSRISTGLPFSDFAPSPIERWIR